MQIIRFFDKKTHKKTGECKEDKRWIKIKRPLIVVGGELTLPMLDLIYTLKIPAIIAARPGLGTINHTLLTINALHQQNIPIIGFVFVHTHKDAGDFTETDNARTISEFGKTKWLGTIPYLPELDSENPPHYSSLPIVFKNIIEQIAEKVFS